MRAFKTKWFARFARQERIADSSLREAIARAEHGLIDADLEPVMNFPAGGVAGENRARQGGGRRLWLFQG